jgi:hypothetical protein
MNDFPKIQSPFVREELNGKYVCTPVINPEYRWVFTEESISVDKLDGTNVSMWVKDKKIQAILNRENVINIWEPGRSRFGVAVLNAISKGYIQPPSRLKDGGYFGEMIGESVQGNPYGVSGHLWVPFERLRTKYLFKFWFDFVKTLKDKSDEEIYNAVSDVFKGLWSIFKRNHCGIQGVVDETIGFEGAASEGIVFYRKSQIDNYSVCCKLRRDMFDWFAGKGH